VVATSGDAKLLYEHAPTLMQHAPVGTTNALIQASRSPDMHLDPRKLLPALIRYQAVYTRGPHTAASSSPSSGAAHNGQQQQQDGGASDRASEYAAAAAGGGAKGNQALRFLLHCVKNLKCKDSVVMKYLVSLLATQPDDRPMVPPVPSPKPETSFPIPHPNPTPIPPPLTRK
jgi:hypothetical protein